MTMDGLDFTPMDVVLGGSGGELAASIDVSDIAARAMSGSLGFSPSGILAFLAQSLAGETRSLLSLTRDIIAIALISALFKAFSSGFKSSASAEAGFYASYMVVAALLLSSLRLCFGIMRDMAQSVCDLITAAQPVMVSLAVLTGGAARGAMASPVVLYAAAFMAHLVNAVVTPLLSFAAVARLVNYLSEKDTLLKLADALHGLVSWGLKTVAAVFVAVLAAQSFAAPAIDGGVARGLRGAVGLAPVVGQALGGVVDAALYWGKAARGGVLTAILIAVVSLCAAPVVKLAAFAVVYKATAALIEPLCDERIVDAIDGAGKAAALALGVAVLVMAACVCMAIVVLSFGMG